MTDPTDPPRLANAAGTEILDVEMLVRHLELIGVQYFGIHGVHAENGTRPDGYFKQNINIAQQLSESAILIRFVLNLGTIDADYAVDVVTEYSMDEPLVIAEPALTEFIERVAIMAAFPFLREGVASTAARLELTVPILGLLKPGGFSITNTTPASDSPES